MHSLDQRITAWRRALAASGTVQDWQITELEDHLLTAFDLAQEEFPSEALAWEAALERTGSISVITEEFAKEQVMSPLSKLAGIGITVGMLAFVISTGPTPIEFLFMPALLFVLALVGGGLVARFGPSKVLRAVNASLRGSSRLEAAEVQTLCEVFDRGYRLAWMSGVVACIAGVIQMLQVLSDPTQIGPGLATCLHGLLYGALLAEVVFANARQWLVVRARATS